MGRVELVESDPHVRSRFVIDEPRWAVDADHLLLSVHDKLTDKASVAYIASWDWEDDLDIFCTISRLTYIQLIESLARHSFAAASSSDD
jgi:hypothetical protein